MNDLMSTKVAPLLELRRHPGLDGPLGPGELRIEEGQIAFLEGESGSGKTRLLRHMVDLETELVGRVFIDGQPLQSLPPSLIRKQIALLPQDLPHHPCTGRELLAQIRSWHANRESHLGEDETDAWLEHFELENHIDKPIHQLSGGEKRRLSLVSCLVPRPRVLLLDEPETGLDPRRMSSLESYCRQLLAERMGILWVSHLDGGSLFAGAARYHMARRDI